MWNEPGQRDLAKLPRLDAGARGLPATRIIHERFFLDGSDWYAAGYDASGEMFFGFMIPTDDLRHAGWGYFTLSGLRVFRVAGLEVNRDLSWMPRRALEIERIRAAGGV